MVWRPPKPPFSEPSPNCAASSVPMVDGRNSPTTLASDAFGTATALYALQQAGVPAKDPAYQRGVRYLISTQKPDGSWHVASRSPKVQPYFQSGFP